MKARLSSIFLVSASSFTKWPPALILIIFFALATNSCGSTDSRKFDSKTWKKKEELRYKMVNDIIGRQLLMGMPKEKVIELLGSDSEQGPCINCIGYSTNRPDQGFSIDHEVLEITFDTQDKVTSVRLNSY